MKNQAFVKASLLLACTLTVMAAAVIAPSLPQIRQVFSGMENAELMSKLLLTLPGLVIAFVAPISGYILDRFGRKKVMITSLILYMLSGTTGFYLESYYAIMVGRVFLGVSVAGIMTACTTLAGDLFQGAIRAKFMGLMSTFMAMGGVVYILIGGLFASYNWHYPFLVYLFGILPLVLSIIYIREPDRQKPQVVSSKNIAQTAVPWANIIFIYLMGFCGMILFYLIPVQVPFFVKSIGVENASMAGYAISTSTLTAAFTSMFYHRIKKILSFQMIYVVSFTFLGLGYFLISNCETFGMTLFSLFFCGLGAGLLMPNANLWLVDVAPASHRGRLVGQLSMAVFLGQFLSPLVLQPIINNLSIAKAFSISSFVLWGIAFCFVIWRVFFVKKQGVTNT